VPWFYTEIMPHPVSFSMEAQALNWLPETPSRIAVGMSGGVDSSAIAYMLKEMGHEVVGLTAWTLNGPGSCCNDALINAGRVCEQLGCEFDTLDLRAEFQHYVQQYYNQSYAAGITPNPCVECNRYIKWERLVQYARETLNCEFIATGHYLNARRPQGMPGPVHLHRAVDERKDQTYMLARVRPEDLHHALFPLGLWQKQDVLAYASERGIISNAYKESVDVCFVPDGQANYLQGVLGKRMGDIREVMTNALLGSHEGHWLFTRGQRKGLGIAHAFPLYVIRTDATTNTVYVGGREHLQCERFTVKEMSWLRPPTPEELSQVQVKVRYAGSPSMGSMVPHVTEGQYAIEMLSPQDAVTPGQIAAIYDVDFSELLGGGYIETYLQQQPFDAETAPALPEPAACPIALDV
jgi:tRNA-uridine 2-sulfurtransferase